MSQVDLSETFGVKTDAKSTATDGTAVPAMAVLKQISASVQSMVTAVGVGATGQAKLEDVAAVDGDMGVPSMAIRKATPVNTSNTDGDYEMLQMTGGRLWTVASQQAIIAAAATIARPGDTTPYTSGDLLANSVTAGSVVISTFTNTARLSGGSGRVMGVRMMKSTNVITNAAFRLHLFTVIPTVATNGDNSPISGNIVASAKGYLGYVDITAMTGFSDVAWGTGAPDNARQMLPFVAVAADIYGLWEVRGAYTPGNAEVFTFALIVDQD
jgi:hypothetical protein